MPLKNKCKKLFSIFFKKKKIVEPTLIEIDQSPTIYAYTGTVATTLIDKIENEIESNLEEKRFNDFKQNVQEAYKNIVKKTQQCLHLNLYWSLY